MSVVSIFICATELCPLPQKQNPLHQGLEGAREWMFVSSVLPETTGPSPSLLDVLDF